jgi:hypothetical protein
MEAQQTAQTTMQKLINNQWLIASNNEKECRLKHQYTTTQLIISVICQGKTTSDTADFYLSNQIETTFDYSKVGNVSDGKYIIFFIPERDGYSYFNVDEIIELDADFMQLKSLKSNFVFRFYAN